MYIGLDVGGTNTDAVLLDASLQCAAYAKVPTTPHDVSLGIMHAMRELLAGQKLNAISRVCVSSTLALNALLTGGYDKTGLLLVPGPGCAFPPSWQRPEVCVLAGAQNHLGEIVARPDEKVVLAALNALKEEGVIALGIVSKFSPKNPALEQWLAQLAERVFPQDTPVVIGSGLSGGLNFPRRVETAWLQAALTRLNRGFIHYLKQSLDDMGLNCPLDILKADGGTFPHNIAMLNPANSIGSGPAASILGAMEEAQDDSDSIIVSIGGTTTDIAVLAHGEPLMLKEGIHVNHKATLIKGMHTHSLALGGDSSLAFVDNRLFIKPERLGPALCLSPEDVGTRPPTLTDALRALDMHSLGSYETARLSLEPLAAAMGASVDEAAQKALDSALDVLRANIDAFVWHLNNQPVYTIREIQYTRRIRPTKVILIGAPAPALAGALAATLDLPVKAPEGAGLANALGAALARLTVDAELYADTTTHTMNIAPYGVSRRISSSYSMKDAEKDIHETLDKALQDVYAQYGSMAGGPMEAELQTVFAETFHTLSMRGEKGRIHRLKAQITPGIIGR